MKARLTADRRFVEIQGQRWFDRWPVSSLPAWLKFYRQMRDRAEGRHAQHYRDTVLDLERIAADLRGPSGPGGPDDGPGRSMPRAA